MWGSSRSARWRLVSQTLVLLGASLALRPDAVAQGGGQQASEKECAELCALAGEATDAFQAAKEAVEGQEGKIQGIEGEREVVLGNIDEIQGEIDEKMDLLQSLEVDILCDFVGPWCGVMKLIVKAHLDALKEGKIGQQAALFELDKQLDDAKEDLAELEEEMNLAEEAMVEAVQAAEDAGCEC